MTNTDDTRLRLPASAGVLAMPADLADPTTSVSTPQKALLHVGTHGLLADRSLAFQLDRWIAYGGDSMLVDIRSVLDRLVTLDGWRSAFLELHDRALAAHRRLDAALHLRSAEFFMLPGDPRRLVAHRTFVSLMREVFNVSAPSTVEYAGAQLPVYRFASVQPLDTVVIFGGFDSYIEELFPIFLALRDAGVDVVAFEGPGRCLRTRHAGCAAPRRRGGPLRAAPADPRSGCRAHRRSLDHRAHLHPGRVRAEPLPGRQPPACRRHDRPMDRVAGPRRTPNPVDVTNGATALTSENCVWHASCNFS